MSKIITIIKLLLLTLILSGPVLASPALSSYVMPDIAADEHADHKTTVTFSDQIAANYCDCDNGCEFMSACSANSCINGLSPPVLTNSSFLIMIGSIHRYCGLVSVTDLSPPWLNLPFRPPIA